MSVFLSLQYMALMERMTQWLEDPQGDVAWASALHASATELSDTLRRFTQQLDLDDDDEDEEEASTSGSSGLTDLEPEAASADHPKPDDECSSSSPWEIPHDDDDAKNCGHV